MAEGRAGGYGGVVDRSEVGEVEGRHEADPRGAPIQPGGAIPWASFTNLSVNAAQAVRTEEGWEMWTHGITGNPNAAGNKGFHGGGAGNKAMLGTNHVDDMVVVGGHQ